jgi:hypothetical protein
VKGGEFCEHGFEAGRCQDEQCPGYWLDADDRVSSAATASPEERIVNAARWYVECQEWGLRTDCSGFELREAVGAVFPDVLNDADALADLSYDRETISGG